MADLRPLVTALVTCAVLAGCTPGTSTPALRPGSRILLFDPKEVSAVEMTAYSPRSHSRWSARFSRDATVSPQGPWQLSGPQLQKHSDRRANSLLLEHWLDALSNLTFKELPSAGRSSAQMGLESPLAAALLQSTDGQLEIVIGARAPTRDESVAHFAQWSLPRGKKQQGIVQGAALQMLEHLTTFTRMRATTWSPWSRTDIVLPLNTRGEKLESALQVWTHLQVLNFLDQLEELPKLPPAPHHQLTLTVRAPETGEPRSETYSVWAQGKRVFGRTTSRPALVELYPKTVPTLQSIARLLR